MIDRRLLRALLALLLCSSSATVQADENSNSANGIHVPAGLDGSGVRIGQVELGRPAKPGLDSNSIATLNPAAVYNLGFAAIANNAFELDSHAHRVASTIIWTDAMHKGTAPGAALYSVGAFVGASTAQAIGQPRMAAATQYLIDQAGPTLRAVNMSFTFNVGAGQQNGGELFTRFVDWSASRHDILYVTASDEGIDGNQGTRGIPQDSFNGLNVGYTRREPNGTLFNRVDVGNVFSEATDGRRLTHIVAPGRTVTTHYLGIGPGQSYGSSFAAPHVTGTVALLQQAVANQIGMQAAGFDSDAQRHQLMKAVIMNSADKLKDLGDGKLLGMEKTIVDSQGADWTASDAAMDKAIPLDEQLGVGQLNASRALTQLMAAEHDSFGTAVVPNIGWDWGVTLGAGDANRYVLDRPLIKDSYIAVTLTWDREVTLDDNLASNDRFDAEVFADTGVPNYGNQGGQDDQFTFLDYGSDGMPGTFDGGEGNGMFDVLPQPEPSEQFVDVNGDGLYSPAAESFSINGLTNLDLYLMPKGETDPANHVWASISTQYSVEHMFFKIPETGEYEIWVRQQNAPLGDQFYALAWWSVVPEPSTVGLLASAVVTLLACGMRRRTMPRTHDRLRTAR